MNIYIYDIEHNNRWFLGFPTMIRRRWVPWRWCDDVMDERTMIPMGRSPEAFRAWCQGRRIWCDDVNDDDISVSVISICWHQAATPSMISLLCYDMSYDKNILTCKSWHVCSSCTLYCVISFKCLFLFVYCSFELAIQLVR